MKKQSSNAASFLSRNIRPNNQKRKCKSGRNDMFYSKKELMELGFEYVGDNTRVSKLANFYVCEGSRIGDDTRIDDYCTFKGSFWKKVFISAAFVFSAPLEALLI